MFKLDHPFQYSSPAYSAILTFLLPFSLREMEIQIHASHFAGVGGRGGNKMGVKLLLVVKE